MPYFPQNTAPLAVINPIFGFGLGLGASGPQQNQGTPANGYVAEDNTTFYVAEDGSTFYVKES